MYLCQLATLLNEQRYLIVFTLADLFMLGDKRPLADIKWVSLQTRVLDSYIKADKYPHQAHRFESLNKPIVCVRRAKDCTEYSCEAFPVVVTLLPKKGNYQGYAERGTIITALETYSTIITLKHNK